MRKVRFLGAVMFLLGSALAQKAFRPYTSPDSRFTISFPGSPKVSAPNQQQTDEGSKFTEQHYSVADDGAYILMTADYPFATDRSALKSIAKEQAVSCGAPPASVLSNNDLQGRPALLFTLDCPKTSKRNAISLIVQAVVDGNRIYRVMYGTSDKADTGRVDTFLMSFHIH
jgi:hypothetical protein